MTSICLDPKVADFLSSSDYSKESVNIALTSFFFFSKNALLFLNLYNNRTKLSKFFETLNTITGLWMKELSLAFTNGVAGTKSFLTVLFKAILLRVLKKNRENSKDSDPDVLEGDADEGDFMANIKVEALIKVMFIGYGEFCKKTVADGNTIASCSKPLEEVVLEEILRCYEID